MAKKDEQTGKWKVDANDPDAPTAEELAYFEAHQGDPQAAGVAGLAAEVVQGQGDQADAQGAAPDAAAAAGQPAAAEGQPAAALAEPVGGGDDLAAAPAPGAPAGEAGDDRDAADAAAAQQIAEAGGGDGAAAEGQQGQQGQRTMVPLPALQEARGEIKELKAEIAKQREMFDRGNERMMALLQAQQAPQQAPAQKQPQTLQEQITALGKAPDPLEDVFAHLAWRGKRDEILTGHVLGLEKKQQGIVQQQAERDDHADLVSRYQEDVRRAAAEDPAFAQAYNHMIGLREGMLRAVPGQTDESIISTIHREELDMARLAFEGGMRPTEMIRTMATNAGWTAPAAPAPNGQAPGDPAAAPNGAAPAPQNAAPAAGAPPAGNGAQPPANVAQQPPAAQQPPVQQQPQAGDGQAQVQRLLDSAPAEQSLSAVGGAGGSPVSIEALANMTDDEWGEFFENHPKTTNQLMGA